MGEFNSCCRLVHPKPTAIRLNQGACVCSVPVNEERPTKSNGSDCLPPEGEPVELTAEQIERRLLAQLQDDTMDRKPTLRQLAYIYSEARRYDQALDYLRQVMALEADLEQKAACVLAMDGTAEKQQNFEAAVRFYREALAMEPERNDVWFFIHNNLGFSLNKLGHFAEGEKCCRAAIEINSSHPNGHTGRPTKLQSIASPTRWWSAIPTHPSRPLMSCLPGLEAT